MAESPAPSGNYFGLVNRVDRGVLVRIVTRGEDASRLPEDPEAIAGKVYSPIERVLLAGLLCVVSVAAVFLITVNAWDVEGFFPWYWNVVWVLFPWVFLGPAWGAYFEKVRRNVSASRFAESYEEFRAESVHVRGTVAGVREKPARHRRVGQLVVDVAYERPTGERASVVAISPDINMPHHEVPEIGAPAHVWLSPDEHTRVVQIPAR
ncbi:hypothetical protein F1721_22220 [Saccharopolyspora hirsuta]|uniref:Uncharacterized protein n=1 Tax=Saccharopolyspora hirsuta TaxID=1837 RepID=A0A5M7BR05_SACHI|nr:hypothetical protein [Saccharopolyspora hirsuta]KAA5830578.1 hypothetical protein F1721_22220 [Saccharopolyspora hirsuta]